MRAMILYKTTAHNALPSLKQSSRKLSIMNPIQIIFPVAALALLSFVVAAFMLRSRIGEMKRQRIHPQKVASRAQSQSVLNDTLAADNYLNLFEMPVLFYTLCLALYLTQLVSLPMLLAAWLYVGLRCLHSFIHIGHNLVMHRFQIFAASVVLLLLMWLGFLAQLLMKL
jgi:hypothetical protein